MISAEQDVLGLDVSVDDAVLVRVRQRVGDFGRDSECVGQRELLLALKPAPERLALDERHGEPELPAGIAGVVDRENVRVLQPGAEADLAQESVGPECLGQFWAKDLESDLPVVLDIVRKVDRGHAAPPQLALDLVSAGQGGSQPLAEDSCLCGVQ
jgi:hypothetical protein